MRIHNVRFDMCGFAIPLGQNEPQAPQAARDLAKAIQDDLEAAGDKNTVQRKATDNADEAKGRTERSERMSMMRAINTCDEDTVFHRKRTQARPWKVPRGQGKINTASSQRWPTTPEQPYHRVIVHGNPKKKIRIVSLHHTMDGSDPSPEK